MQNPEVLEPIRPIRRDEWRRMGEIGLFEDERVELLYGRVVPMSPMGKPLRWTVRSLARILTKAAPPELNVSVGLPVAASEISEPEPDLAVQPVLPYALDQWDKALLVVEVSSSTLRKDRLVKAPIYAEMGVAEYWIINLVDRVAEVHREPRGGRYLQVTTVRPGEPLVSLAMPELVLDLEAFLPPEAD